MKFLIVIAVIVQLSLANETNVAVVKPPCDKLYPIYDFIATKMQEFDKLQYIWMIGVLNKALPAYHKYMETHNTKEYKEFNDVFRKIISKLEEFKKDPENCKLHRDIVAAAAELSKKRPADEDLTKFFENLAHDFHIEEDPSLIVEIAEQFPDLIRKFIESLTEEEKLEYPEVYQASEQIIFAAKGEERYRAIESFLKATKYDEHFTEPTDDNCKWDLGNFKKFVNRMSYMA